VSYVDIDGRTEVTATLGPFPILAISGPTNINHRRGYLYLDVNYPEPVVWTFGASYDDYDETGMHEREVNPKLGIQWHVTDDLRLRAALFQTIKPALASNRTIEPTQVAGFNQFFDDADATKSLRWGVGLDWEPDWRPLSDVHFGGEMTWRRLDEPTFLDDIAEFEGRDERVHQVYVYWTPLDEVAVAAEFHYDRYRAVPGGSDVTATNLSGNRPEYVRTLSVPVHIRYFAPWGLFAGLGLTYVDQTVRRAPVALPQGSDEFFVVDAAIGYRLPGRRGLVSLEVRNLLDREFRYQDDSFREFADEPSIGPYIPSRTLMVRATLTF
jgi:outer membrane receptor protein involved in Fe transport